MQSSVLVLEDTCQVVWYYSMILSNASNHIEGNRIKSILSISASSIFLFVFYFWFIFNVCISLRASHSAIIQRDIADCSISSIFLWYCFWYNNATHRDMFNNRDISSVINSSSIYFVIIIKVIRILPSHFALCGCTPRQARGYWKPKQSFSQGSLLCCNMSAWQINTLRAFLSDSSSSIVSSIRL